jgi:hypothetical protein
MRPFETADVASIEMLKARHETLKAQLAAAEGAQDAQRAASIAAELQENGGQGVRRASSNCRPTHSAHGRALTLLVATTRRIGRIMLAPCAPRRGVARRWRG